MSLIFLVYQKAGVKAVGKLLNRSSIIILNFLRSNCYKILILALLPWKVRFER